MPSLKMAEIQYFLEIIILEQFYTVKNPDSF